MSGELDRTATELAVTGRSTYHLLSTYGPGAVADRIGGWLARVEQWCADTAASLRWRAEAIERGQQAAANAFDPSIHTGLRIAIERASFALNTGFLPGDLDIAFREITVATVDPQRVTDATRKIRRWLDQRWNDWDVTNTDLQNTASELRGLTGAELDAVVARLKPGELVRWIDEMNASINGFSRPEKRELFTHLAATAGGESLARIHDAILDTEDPIENALDFGMSVGRSGRPEVVEIYVSRRVDDLDHMRVFGGIGLAEALSGLDDADATDRHLARIIEGAMWDHFLADTRLGSGSLDSAATALAHASPATLASAFVATVPLIGMFVLPVADHRAGVGGVPIAFPVADRTFDDDLRALLTDVISADPVGVVTELARGMDAGGRLTTDWLHHQMLAEEFDSVVPVIDGLRGSSPVAGDWFAVPGGSGYPYPNAQNLGFMAGALSAAAARIAADADSKIDAIALLASTTEFVAGVYVLAEATLARWLAGGTGFASGLTVAVVADRTKNDIDHDLTSLVGLFRDALRPSLDVDAVAANPELGAASVVFESRFATVFAGTR